MRSNEKCRNWNIKDDRNNNKNKNNLATDDGDSRKRVPKSRQCAGFTVVAKSRTSSLNFVNQRNQVLHFISKLSRYLGRRRRQR